MDKLLDATGNNWKSAVGGFGLLLVGIGGLIMHLVAPDSSFAIGPPDCWVMIGTGLAALGIGHKAARTEKEVKALRSSIQ